MIKLPVLSKEATEEAMEITSEIVAITELTIPPIEPVFSADYSYPTLSLLTYSRGVFIPPYLFNISRPSPEE